MINLGNMSIADLRLGASQVKAAYLGSEQIWGGEEPVPTAEPLCFTAVQDNSTVKLAQYNSPPAVSLETSTDGETWADYTNNSTLTLASIGDKVYFRAKTENSSMASNWNKYNYFVMTGKIAASGNIQSLLKSDCSRTDVPIYGYGNLFYNCASLVTPPELPATTLNERSYNAMFYKCSSLSVAPALPATTLYDRTYNGMFEDCTSLSAAPELPATTLGECSYENLFRGCRNLTSIKVAFTTWTSNLANNWVNGVAASGTFTCPAALGDDSTITRGTSNCPNGWTVVNT